MLETIPPTELMKYLNQKDLSALNLVNKRFNFMYGPLCKEIRQFSETRANKLNIEAYLLDPKTFQIEYEWIDYLLNSNCKKSIRIHKTEDYGHGLDFSVIVDLINLVHLPIKKGDIINFTSMKKERKKSGTIMLHIVPRNYIPIVAQFVPILIRDNLYLINYFGWIPFQNISPYHWSDQMIISDIIIPYRYLYLHFINNVIKYIEINYGKFRFRLDCIEPILFLILSPNTISVRISTYSGNNNKKIYHVEQICAH